MPENLDASSLRSAMEIYLVALERHQDELNSLNVYPVPDGDTGTNMVLTQRSVVAALDGIPADPGQEEADRMRSLREAISRASLIGARGNSGVILSQILRGLCERLADGPAGPSQVADALANASAEAWRAVARPAEGTVLTVIRDGAEAASAASTGSEDLEEVVEAAVRAARDSLARTKDTLPELRSAGVVDAGAKGVVLLLDALQAALSGRDVDEPIDPSGPVRATDQHGPSDGNGMHHEVQFLLEAGDAAVSSLRRQLAELGESLVIVGGGGLYNVHVHTDDPDRAVEEGRRAGVTRDVSVTALPGSGPGCIGGQARAVQVADQATALIVVAEGEGLARIFRSLGAIVIPGRPGVAPPADELDSAIGIAPANQVIVLVHDRGLEAAESPGAAERGTRVHTMRTRSIPGRLAAATAFHPGATLEENWEVMREAASTIRSGRMIRAGRHTDAPTGRIRPGDWMGLIDGTLACVAADAAVAAAELASRLGADGGELLTVIAGAAAPPEEADRIARNLRERFPALSVEAIGGGQPDPFVIGVE